MSSSPDSGRQVDLAFQSQGSHSIPFPTQQPSTLPWRYFFVPRLIPRWMRDSSNKRYIYDVSMRFEKQRFQNQGVNNLRFSICTMFEQST